MTDEFFLQGVGYCHNKSQMKNGDTDKMSV